jgi:hypothetical protein
MENTLYYTFSTIAQSLAGAIAFLGAFVLFRLQAISHMLNSSAELLARAWMGDSEIQRAVAARDYPVALLRAEHLVKQPVPSGWGLIHQAALEGMQQSLAQRSLILRTLRGALVLTALVMTGAVVVLASVSTVASPPPLAYSILATGVAAFGASIFAIGRLVWRLTHDA